MKLEEFERIKARLKQSTDIPESTFDMIHDVLVNGKKQSEVAKKNNISRQRVNKVIQKFLKLKNNIPADWVKISVWLPQELADQVKEMAEDAQKRLDENNRI